MPEKIRDTAEFAFIETVASGTVHIEVRYASYDDPYENTRDGPPEKMSFAEGMQALLMGPHITLCGVRTYPVSERTHHYTNCFPDEQLCQRCHRRLHSDDIERAFRHAQPNDLYEDEEG